MSEDDANTLLDGSEDSVLPRQHEGGGIPDLPAELPILPTGANVIFPGMMVPLVFAGARAIRCIDDTVVKDRLVALAAQKDPDEEDPDPGSLHEAGCAAAILKMLRFPDNTTRILAQGIARVAIGVYEAEMNLIFYAGGGRISARIEPERIRIEVEDEGPGIPDVSKAIEPGFSTAPDWVREMGFGAGMGLHNITSCSDDMRLESTVDVGTRLVFDFRLEDGHGAS